jgi:hypothetical protein
MDRRNFLTILTSIPLLGSVVLTEAQSSGNENAIVKELEPILKELARLLETINHTLDDAERDKLRTAYKEKGEKATELESKLCLLKPQNKQAYTAYLELEPRPTSRLPHGITTADFERRDQLQRQEATLRVMMADTMMMSTFSLAHTQTPERKLGDAVRTRVLAAAC